MDRLDTHSKMDDQFALPRSARGTAADPSSGPSYSERRNG